MEHKEYLAACAALKQTPMQLSDFDRYPEEDRVSKFALHRIDTVIKADNLTADNGKPFTKNWGDIEDMQQSWQLWYRRNKDKSRPSGVGFSFCDAICDCSSSDVRSRLGCFSAERAKAILDTEEMIEAYSEYMGV